MGSEQILEGASGVPLDETRTEMDAIDLLRRRIISLLADLDSTATQLNRLKKENDDLKAELARLRKGN